jgi:hypothetical protein
MGEAITRIGALQRIGQRDRWGILRAGAHDSAGQKRQQEVTIFHLMNHWN